jgi:hypothetical protein
LCYTEAKPILLQEADFYIDLSADCPWQSPNQKGLWLSLAALGTLRHISVTLRGNINLADSVRLRRLITLLPELQSVTSYVSPPSHSYAFTEGHMIMARPNGSLDADNLKKFEDIVEFGFHRCLHGSPWARAAGEDAKPRDIHDLLGAWQSRVYSFELTTVTWSRAHYLAPLEERKSPNDFFDSFRSMRMVSHSMQQHMKQRRRWPLHLQLVKIDLKTRVVCVQKADQSAGVDMLYYPACGPEHTFILDEAAVENILSWVDHDVWSDLSTRHDDWRSSWLATR